MFRGGAGGPSAYIIGQGPTTNPPPPRSRMETPRSTSLGNTCASWGGTATCCSARAIHHFSGWSALVPRPPPPAWPWWPPQLLFFVVFFIWNRQGPKTGDAYGHNSRFWPMGNAKDFLLQRMGNQRLTNNRLTKTNCGNATRDKYSEWLYKDHNKKPLESAIRRRYRGWRPDSFAHPHIMAMRRLVRCAVRTWERCGPSAAVGSTGTIPPSGHRANSPTKRCFGLQTGFFFCWGGGCALTTTHAKFHQQHLPRANDDD